MKLDKRLSQKKVALISWLIIISINFFQLVYVKLTIPDRYSWEDVFYYPLTSLTIGIFLIFIWILPLFNILRRFKIGIQIPLFIIHGFIFASLYIILIFIQFTLWSEKLTFDSSLEKIHKFFYTDFHNIAKNYFFLLAVFIAVEYINKREDTLLKQKELENQLREAKIQALESKLHPHFLFNALNGITALVNENPRKAEKAIVELSDLLRFSLEGNLQKLISLDEEMELLGKFISIEKMRYEDQLEVTIDIEKDVNMKKALIPPLILQPIIENAIIHGFKGINHPLKISISVKKNKIEIANNGSDLSKNKRDGSSNGIRIVEQRLKHHFENEVNLDLYENEGKVICEIKGLNL